MNNNDEIFFVTIKVELQDGTSRESKYATQQELIHQLLWSNGIEKMHDDLLESNPLI